MSLAGCKVETNPMKMLDVECEVCGHVTETLVRSDGIISNCDRNVGTSDNPMTCGGTRHRVLLAGKSRDGGSTGNVLGDDIPGGIWMKHGICNPDGTPKRYDTRSSIREAARKAGYEVFTDPIPVLNENIENALKKNKNQNARWSCPAVLSPEDEAERLRHWHETETELQRELREK